MLNTSPSGSNTASASPLRQEMVVNEIIAEVTKAESSRIGIMSHPTHEEGRIREEENIRRQKEEESGPGEKESLSRFETIKVYSF